MPFLRKFTKNRKRPVNFPDSRVITVMRQIFEYNGRGREYETPRSGYHIECASGRVLAITEMFGQVELILSYCREAVVDQWGVCCIHPFHRVSDVACTRSWAQQDKESLMLFRRVRVHLAAEEPWMQRPA